MRGGSIRFLSSFPSIPHFKKRFQNDFRLSPTLESRDKFPPQSQASQKTEILFFWITSASSRPRWLLEHKKKKILKQKLRHCSRHYPCSISSPVGSQRTIFLWRWISSRVLRHGLRCCRNLMQTLGPSEGWATSGSRTSWDFVTVGFAGVDTGITARSCHSRWQMAAWSRDQERRYTGHHLLRCRRPAVFFRPSRNCLWAGFVLHRLAKPLPVRSLSACLHRF